MPQLETKDLGDLPCMRELASPGIAQRATESENMIIPPTSKELEAKYGKPERIDSAANAILMSLGLSAAVPDNSIVMVHRYQSSEAFEAYKAANPVQYEIARPNDWGVTYYGPAFIGTGVYGVIIITRKGDRHNDGPARQA